MCISFYECGAALLLSLCLAHEYCLHNGGGGGGIGDGGVVIAVEDNDAQAYDLIKFARLFYCFSSFRYLMCNLLCARH